MVLKLRCPRPLPMKLAYSSLHIAKYKFNEIIHKSHKNTYNLVDNPRVLNIQAHMSINRLTISNMINDLNHAFLNTKNF